MVDTGSPSLMSRTSPMNAATAPTLRLPARSAATSALKSKSSAWTRTGISASGDRRKERDFVAGFDRRRRLRHGLVHCDAKRAVRAECVLPRVASLHQVRAQRRHGVDVHWQVDRLLREAQLLAKRGEVKQLDAHASG